MKISREDVLHVAELAHLELADAEVEKFRQQLDAILSYVDKLNQLDTTNVEPMAQSLAGAADDVLRDDIAAGCDVAGAVLAGAPDPSVPPGTGASKPYFRVPKVIDR